ncbi:hypothetical protein KIPE111705_05425 [Kibdelosporangium persicum]|uniref:Immunity protein 35 n=1 Tax=Kibdelosporangium persicum TaxID=2698649 RepID=A0ABX2FCV3_9PSEU|nr:hypothetical protein [Kibdelosporangium persicum]NRN69186.1 hypothetical protein [Kibdelosporangium persicum]
MTNPTIQSAVDTKTDDLTELQPPTSEAGFADLVAEMVADQAPRLFAVVLELGTQVDAQIVAWGIAFEESAYMVTVDGRNQYALANAEAALKYVRSDANITSSLVWATPAVHTQE